MEKHEEDLEFNLIVQLLSNDQSILNAKLLKEYLKKFNEHSNLMVNETLNTAFRGLGQKLRKDAHGNYSDHKATFWTSSVHIAEGFKKYGLDGEADGNGVILMIENYPQAKGFELSQLIKNNKCRLDKLTEEYQKKDIFTQKETRFLKAMRFSSIELQNPEDCLWILPYKGYEIIGKKNIDGIDVIAVKPIPQLGLFYPDIFK